MIRLRGMDDVVPAVPIKAVVLTMPFKSFSKTPPEEVTKFATGTAPRKMNGAEPIIVKAAEGLTRPSSCTCTLLVDMMQIRDRDLGTFWE